MGNCCSCERIYALLSGTTTSRANYTAISDSDKSSEEVSPFQKDRSSYHADDQPKKVVAPVSQAIEIAKLPIPSSIVQNNNNGLPPISGNSSAHPKSGFSIEYELKEEIGLGSTSKCYRCCRKSDGMEFACKVIDKRQVEAKFNGLLDQFFVEIKVLKSLNHPNIIHLQDTFETPDRIYIVMEMMKGGELFDYVVEKGTLSEEEASIIIRKITSAIAHMHGLNIIHRGLKPENLLLTTKGADAEVKLIDFGLAKEMSDSVARSFLGTRGYLAPEMLQRHTYDKEIDIWALGVIAFVILCGCLPFDDDSSRINSDSAVRKKFTLRFPRWAASLSTSAKDLLHNLLDVNPKTRYTAEQALNHPWVSGRTVQLNNYLQSPSMLGERRNELRNEMNKSPLISHERERVSLAAAAAVKNTLDVIKEEQQQQTNGLKAGATTTAAVANTQRYNNFTTERPTTGYVRKNSI